MTATNQGNMNEPHGTLRRGTAALLLQPQNQRRHIHNRFHSIPLKHAALVLAVMFGETLDARFKYVPGFSGPWSGSSAQEQALL